MIVLGIADGHSSSAALLREGEIIGVAQEERLSRTKNQTGFPKLAIEELVADNLGGDFSRIDHVILASKIIDPYFIALDHYSQFSTHDWVREMHVYWKPYFYGDRAGADAYWSEWLHSGRRQNLGHHFDLDFLRSMPRIEALAHFNDHVRPATFARHFNAGAPASRRMDHHEAHAYYALYGGELRPEDRSGALVLTADAWGDGANWSAWTAAPDGKLTRVGGGSDHIVARLYKFVTLILGMKPNEHEYKVMGLSAYSKPSRYVSDVEAIFFEVLDFADGQFVSRKPLRDSYFDLKDRLEGHRFDNVSAGLQAWASKITCQWARHWLRKTGRDVLCFSGGLSMNIKANGDLLALPEIRVLSVPASGGDESLSIGACFAAAADRGVMPRGLSHVYLGSAAKEPRAGIPGFEILDGIGPTELARLLAMNIIVARCAGRSEFGARSLGNRSILANPSDPGNLSKINDSVKNRDFWMPFTPSIQAEHAGRYLDNPKSVFSPFMTIGFPTRPEAHRDLAAAIHPADKSARPQMVRQQDNPDYWEIIEAFRKATGIPGVLNTSLNLHGDPMNYTIEDAVRTVEKSNLTVLAMPHDRLACKPGAGAAVRAALAE